MNRSSERPIYKIRRENLKAIIGEGSQAAAARTMAVRPAYISQLLGGHANFGSHVAHRIERTFDKPEGWMDWPHGESIHLLPVLEWDDLYDYPAPERKGEHRQRVPKISGDEDFALCVQGHVMEPMFPPGSIIGVRARRPEPGDYVVGTHAGLPLFRRYVVEENQGWFTASDPAYPAYLRDETSRILGTVRSLQWCI